MGSIEKDVKVLKKILNSELFLGKYPIIERVFVDEQYGNKIDIVMSITDPSYWKVSDEIKSYIWNISKMASVTSKFNIYP